MEASIDNVGCFSMNFQDHLHSLDTTLIRLQAKVFSINPSKCEWAVQETDSSGYWLTPTRLKPWSKTVQGLSNMSCFTSQSQASQISSGCVYLLSRHVYINAFYTIY